LSFEPDYPWVPRSILPSSALKKYWLFTSQPFKGLSGKIDASITSGREVKRWTHKGGWQATSNQQAMPTAGTLVKQIAKKAGPSAGSANV
jgi:hypothetical protein